MEDERKTLNMRDVPPRPVDPEDLRRTLHNKFIEHVGQMVNHFADKATSAAFYIFWCQYDPDEHRLMEQEAERPLPDYIK